MSAGKFVPGKNDKNCGEQTGGWGIPSEAYDYIWKGDISQSDYPGDACPPRYHKTAQIDGLKVNTIIQGTATSVDLPASNINCTNLTATGTVTASAFAGAAWSSLVATVGSKKSFDIVHPTKEGHRLRYVCLEGPEAGVYYRGRLSGSDTIELPDYWIGLVDVQSITVTLTQIRTSQDLIVDAIENGRRIRVKSGNNSNIDCFYLVHAERADGEKLIPEYEGTTSADYPGDKDQYSLNR